MNVEYTTPLGLTSQFCFCGLPFRLDTYSGCNFNCSYCFARLRGGKTASKKLKIANPSKIIKRFSYAISDELKATGLVSEVIRQRLPLHFGGMSDPFQPAEYKMGVSLKVLNYLCDIKYPVVISTKSPLVATERYINVLRKNSNILVQFSFSTTKDYISNYTEPSAPNPSEILKAVNRLSELGINTSIRWQPYIPNVSEDPATFIKRISNTGAKHISFEHLKLPFEKNSDIWKNLSKNLDFDVYSYYKSLGSNRDGREFILPAKYKIDRVKEVKNITNQHGMTFGAADNELQYLSDTNCCCSGADQFDGFENWHKYQISHAIKKSKFGEIRYDLIESYWKPKGAVDKYLNSNSRIKKLNNCHNTVEDYILDRWQNLNSPFNPTMFYNVVYANKTDKHGRKIYSWANQIC